MQSVTFNRGKIKLRGNGIQILKIEITVIILGTMKIFCNHLKS